MLILGMNFNPRSPWGERRGSWGLNAARTAPFQSTLPVGGATGARRCVCVSAPFQSTLPVGGATYLSDGNRNMVMISIHAPRGGSDTENQELHLDKYDFNPRSPWGERPDHDGDPNTLTIISIHAPRGGSDLPITSSSASVIPFQSTLPVGGATYKRIGLVYEADEFQSTLPVGGATADLHNSTSAN